jgi:hypothetical protein
VVSLVLFVGAGIWLFLLRSRPPADEPAAPPSAPVPVEAPPPAAGAKSA